MKCLPLSKVSTANGNTLHDWHAEVLAMRAFNCYLLEECDRLASSSQAVSNILERRVVDKCMDSSYRQPFAIIRGAKIFMYCSEAPCGRYWPYAKCSTTE